MKASKFLTLVLVANTSIAIASDWQPANKMLVIANALAVLALVAIQFIFRKD